MTDWDLAHQEALDELTTYVSVHPSGDYVAISQIEDSNFPDGGVQVFETSGWTEVYSVVEGDEIETVDFSADGQWLAYGIPTADDFVRVIDTSDWSTEVEIELANSVYGAVKFSPDSERLAIGNGTTLSIYDTGTWSEETQFDPGSTLQTVCWYDNDYILSGDRLGELHVNEVGNGWTKVTTLSDSGDWVRDVAVSENGSWLSKNGDDDVTHIYDASPDSPTDWGEQFELTDATNDIGQFAFDAQTAWHAVAGGSLHIYDVSDSWALETELTEPSNAQGCAFYPGRLYVGSSGTLYVYDAPVAESEPSNLTVVDASETSISLDWEEESGDPDHYNIYRSRQSGSNLSDYDKIDETSGPETNYTDSGLVNGRRYYYRVTGVLAGEESDPSGETSGLTELPPPTLSDASGGDREISMSLQAEDNNSEGTMTVLRDGSDIDTVDHDTTSYTDTGADLDGQEYSFQIERDTGDATATSGTESATTDLPPLEGMEVVAVDGRHATIQATDPSNNSSGYRLLLREDDEGSYEQDGNDVDPVAEGETVEFVTTELLDGQLYGATAETFTDDATAREDE
ncbi:hypothetical protein GCM10009725_30050 [Aeromicrobium tamlense]